MSAPQGGAGNIRPPLACANFSPEDFVLCMLPLFPFGLLPLGQN